MYAFFLVCERFDSITDEGIIALANLPKLESLELSCAGSFTYRVLNHFTTLKKLTIRQIENMKDGVRNLLQHSTNIQQILILYTSKCKIIEVLKCAAETIKQRDSDIPLFVISEYLFSAIGFRVRIVPVRSEKFLTKKLLFELFYGKQKVTSDFITYDLDILIKEAESLIKHF